jgi:hypothetical protein
MGTLLEVAPRDRSAYKTSGAEAGASDIDEPETALQHRGTRS